MAWFLLFVAGLLEMGWAVGLKYTDGLTRPIPSVLTAVMLIGSITLLALAARTLPIGTAYSVWVGIGAFGASVLGVLLFREPVTPARVFFLALLGVAIVGLKLSSGAAPSSD
jgi:quaternary ammonium compound-resistance protein SugE